MGFKAKLQSYLEPGAFLFTKVEAAVSGVDIIASPGAAKRTVLYRILVANIGAATGSIVLSEVTPANAVVQQIMRLDRPVGQDSQFEYGGLSFGADNKLRVTGVPGTTFSIHVSYRTEPV